jgi:hypothetical protein
LGFNVDKTRAERNPSLGMRSRCPRDDLTRLHVEQSDMRRERHDRCGILRKWEASSQYPKRRSSSTAYGRH